MTAPRPAPAVMPRIPGSASGLRTVPCTTQPARRQGRAGQHRGGNPRETVVQCPADQVRGGARSATARDRRCAATGCRRAGPPAPRPRAAVRRRRLRRGIGAASGHRGGPAAASRSGPESRIRSRQDHDQDGTEQCRGNTGGNRTGALCAEDCRAARRRPAGSAALPGDRRRAAGKGAGRAPVRVRPSRRASTGAPSPTKAMGPASVTEMLVSSTAQSTDSTRVEATGTPRDEAVSSPSFEDIEPAAEQQRDAQHRNDHRGRPDGGVQVQLGERSAAPGEQAGGVFLEQDEQHGGAGVERHGDRGTGKDQAGGAGADGAAGQAQHDGGGQHPAGECDACRRPTAERTGRRPRPRSAQSRSPAVTARVSGEASAFRVTDCSSAPATPRANPTATPANRRGSREPTSTSATGTPPTVSSAPPKSRHRSAQPRRRKFPGSGARHR